VTTWQSPAFGEDGGVLPVGDVATAWRMMLLVVLAQVCTPLMCRARSIIGL
jgi:hypothetical protein